MRLNRKWLNEDFVDLREVSDKEFVETMTVFGQKVETWERMAMGRMRINDLRLIFDNDVRFLNQF